jgi:hypothetical protein
VFGRNPTFNDVTIEGQLTFDGDIDINSDLKVDGNLEVTGNTSTDKITATGTYQNPLAVFNSTSGYGRIVFQENGTPRQWLQTLNGADGLKLMNGDGTTEVMRSQSNNISIANGNLVIGTSGKGIDFSATAGTGTSELLDDYEEGVWTPVFSDASSGGNTATGSAYGYYIKVGGLVYVTGQFENVTTTGMTGGNLLYVQGIPYTPTSVGNDIFFMGSVKADGVTNSGFVSVESVDNFAWLRFAETNGATGGHLTVSDFASGTADIFFSLCYRSIL